MRRSGSPPGERVAFLEQACAGDEGLLREVKSLLGYEVEADLLFEQPVSATVTRKLAIGGTRFGPYELLDWIGSGGMGEVYRARDTRLGREVAIKVLPEGAADDAGRLRRFEREGRSAAALNHPNIATVYEVGEHEGTRFIAMELVEGQTLKDRLEAGRLSVKELVDFASQIARGLAKAHASGFVHRDLKPGNLMVTSDGLVKILDFGLARRTPHASDVGSGITREGTVLGTVEYMSPEQAAARPHDHRSDQFSFGAILYEMATGRRAFERDTAPQTLAAIIEDEPESVRTLNAEVPAGLSAIVERCLAKDPDRRYASTADLVRELALVSAPALPLRSAARRGGGRRPASRSSRGSRPSSSSRYASRPDAPVPREIRLEAVPFTSYTGREAEPTFSPDGAQVAFTWDGENQDNPRHLRQVGRRGAAAPPDLQSRAGREPGLVARRHPDRLPPRQARWRLGSAPHPSHRRTRAHDRGGAGPGPPGALVVSRRPLPGHRGSIVAWRPPRDLRSGHRDRREEAAHPASTHGDILPAFSPDGRTVAFNRTLLPRGPFVHVVPVAGGEPRELVPTSFPRGRLAWMPGAEGDSLRRGARRTRRRSTQAVGRGKSLASLWRVPADGGEARLLAGSENAVDVAVSADGHRLVYSQGTMDWDIWRLDLRRGPATEEAQARFVSSTKIDANPQFAPDGERVAFTSDRSGQAEIWVVDGQGRHPLRLTYLGGGSPVPRGGPRTERRSHSTLPRKVGTTWISTSSALWEARRGG